MNIWNTLKELMKNLAKQHASLQDEFLLMFSVSEKEGKTCDPMCHSLKLILC
jgi:hypothetical protein